MRRRNRSTQTGSCWVPRSSKYYISCRLISAGFSFLICGIILLVVLPPISKSLSDTISDFQCKKFQDFQKFSSEQEDNFGGFSGFNSNLSKQSDDAKKNCNNEGKNPIAILDG